MTDLNTLLAERDIARLVVQYCEFVDTRQYDRVVSLFAKDGILNRPDVGASKGHSGIKAFFETVTTDPLVHSASNIIVQVTGANTAEGSSYVTAFRSYRKNHAGIPKIEAPYLIVKYNDKYVCENGRWLISFRDTLFLMRE